MIHGDTTHSNGKIAWMRPVVTALVGAVLMLMLGMTGIDRALAADDGRLMGRVVDAQSGESLVGLSVYLEGTKMGAMTDMDGMYIIKNIPPDTYTLIVSGIGYKKQTMEGLVVEAGETRKLDFSLSGSAVTTDSIVVTGRLLQNTGATMLKHRQKADFVGDAISAEEISRGGGGDAASAMERVVGASVVGGKYVYVRGLGDRYANTQLNGSPLPSPDPDKQAVQMDLIPAGLLDNIVVQKTFTPDKPGNFTGGSVNMTTKDLPDGRMLRFSTSTSYNSLSTFNDGVLTYAGGSKDWAGYDDGSRSVPDQLIGYDPPNPIRILRDTALARQYNEANESLNSQMSPGVRRAPLNQSYSLAYGDLFEMFERPLGIQGSLTYGRKHSYYENGAIGRWKLTGGSAQTLFPEVEMSDARGVDEVHWGGLASLSYHIHSKHKIRFNYMHNRSGESSARYMIGHQLESADSSNFFETRVLQYTERSLSSGQLSGRHEMDLLTTVRANWQTSYAKSEQDEPDLRFFTNDFFVDGTDTTYRISVNFYRYPNHYFRELDETNRDGKLDLEFPFNAGEPGSGSFKTGGSYLDKERSFRQRAFEIKPKSPTYYNGDPDWFFSDNNMGVIDTALEDGSLDFSDLGNTVSDVTEFKDNYDGEQKISAGYFMVDYPLFDRLQVIAGVRVEHTRMSVIQVDIDSATTEPLIDGSEWLPALNLRYLLTGNMNLRAAYGRTLARPTLRELAPFDSEEFSGGYIYIGNGELEYTKVHNYDLRWEWFNGPGEVLAVSAFYKEMQDPIELAILNVNNQVSPQNVNDATVIGMEFEWRQNLAKLSSTLRNFALSGNVTIVHSAVDIPPSELESIRGYDPDADETRPLQGQSPFILNLDLNYSHYESDFQTSILYNVFGERYVINGKQGTPDIYEQSRHMLDWTASKRLFGNTKLKLGVSNILNSKVKMVHEYKGTEYPYAVYEKGTTFKIGMSYSL